VTDSSAAPAPASAHEAPSAEQIDFTITTPGLDAEEVAAVTAVLQGALSDAAESGHDEPPAETNGWQKSRRDLRTPMHPGPGEWRRGR
jgi:hypothetical protein